MVLELNIKVLSKHVFEPFGQRISFLIPIMEQALRNISRQTGRQAYDAFAMMTQQVIINTRFIIVAVNKGLTGQKHEVFIPLLVLSQQDQMPIFPVFPAFFNRISSGGHISLNPQDRLYTFSQTSPVKINDPIHDPVICNGHSCLSQFLGPAHQFFNAAGSIQQAVLGMHMQMHKGTIHTANLPIMMKKVYHAGVKKKRKRNSQSRSLF